MEARGISALQTRCFMKKSHSKDDEWFTFHRIDRRSGTMSSRWRCPAQTMRIAPDVEKPCMRMERRHYWSRVEADGWYDLFILRSYQAFQIAGQLHPTKIGPGVDVSR